MDNSISNEQLAMCNDSQPRKMKYSGVEWIGDIPAEWVLERLQWHITEIKETNNPIKTTQILSLTNKQGIIPYEEKGEQGNKAKENYTDYKIAYPNTIVANSMNILIGSVGICNYYGCVSPVYYVFSPNSGENLHFLNYVFQMHQFQRDLRRYANGILEIRLRLSSGNILKRKIAFPPLPEQQAIADILDRKCTQIDALIANEEQQIAKLKAYKQSVITETVTKGLPEISNEQLAISNDLQQRKMKDSGVEWIGEIPENADITKVSHLFYVILGKMVSPKKTSDNETLENYFCAANIHFDDIQYDGLKMMWFTPDEKSAYGVKKGDLLVVEGGAGAGGSHIVDRDVIDCYIQNSVMIVRKKKSIPEKWLYYMMYMLVNNNYIDYICNKATIPHFTKDKLSNTPVVYYEEEQMEIMIEYLDQKCEQIDRLIAIKQQKIEKIQQYKKSVIYEYVTGKREVST